MKVNKTSPDFVTESQNWLKEKFPSCFVEGKLDFEKLKQLVFEITDDGIEKYSFSWAGKSNSIRNIQTISHGTLIPDMKDSVNFDDTKNIFIEGENLEVLKLLQKSYTGKIKMIYIDPPYNTGNSFVYEDNFSDGLNSYLDKTTQSKNGINLTSNPETSGRFHSDWMSFIYSRLFLIRNLMKTDGIIFISIDDNELHNLRLVMNDIFGEENFIAILPTIMNLKGNNDQFGFAGTHEYTLVFAKEKEFVKINEFPILEDDLDEWDEDELGFYKKGANLKSTGTNAPREKRPNLYFPIYVSKNNHVSLKRTDNSDVELFPITDYQEMSWRWSKEKISNNMDDVIVSRTDNTISLYKKQRPSLGDLPSKKPKSIFYKPEYSSGNGTQQIKKIFGNKVFDNPKPLDLLKDLLILGTNDDDLILDPFAGSGTLSQAILELNSSDNFKRKFISIQIPESTKKNSIAFQMDFKTISHICKERIKKSILNLKEKTIQKKLLLENVDLGFKVFKLTKSNYKIWEDVKDKTKLKEQLTLFEDPLIKNYKDIDVIYEIILKEGYSLNSKIQEFSEKPNKIYKVIDDEFFFYVTLGKKLNEKSISELKLDKNTMFVCLDSALDDSQKTNLDRLCKLRTI